MKNEINENNDELAAIGIGAMIVFIALILVAAVAAAVIIQTAEKLQQNAQAAGDDTQEQMSTKVTLISTVVENMAVGTESLFSTFELAAGSQPILGSDIGFTVICPAVAPATTASFADGSFLGATIHTGNGAGAAAITLNPGTTYVVSIGVPNCPPTTNTYESLQYGSSPAVGDVVV